MLFDLPDDDTLYRALIARDDRFDGQAFVCVATTGIFCRLTCPARKPRRENCTFHPRTADCLSAGFRPCKRCHPLAPVAQADPAVTRLLAAVDADPDRRWTETAVARMGFDPSTVRRAFQRHFAMTFLQLARQRRVSLGVSALADGDRVIAAQHAAGFESPAAFRVAFARLLGCAPGALSSDPLLWADWIATPLGDMVAVSSRTHLHLLEFVDRPALPAELRRLRTATKGALGLGPTDPTRQLRGELAAFFEGRSARFETPLHLDGSAFARIVWDALRAIPAGETRSYSRLARDIGRPEAVRAVARANGTNQIALLVPCHRVIGADGALTGYGGGLWRKQRLLEIEAQYLSEGRPE
ncbi:bifunctional transcriptional activator/DNA repair enzyme AdaA [Jannaschia pohangensis]|uniref:methylated-DNA--[protein]-cysteine S-methyltransferase n=1 Tax=Jannaschia pohangensis TaxID=390807 RepID=A0A1I3MUL8_9RHOB|nr:trifunctional transcriptional activator/DNA repair protein Ada/methylated-DNA--[protein]-cysteine S-methyltransferase [Jannaschia pohangensis]SFJ00376.1 AraC family transcriptional regulator, regulatory protein of adaptative response / methylated-DNA-[protein]-cysteine methyltransferase [Jannaschia pohangensis]